MSRACSAALVALAAGCSGPRVTPPASVAVPAASSSAIVAPEIAEIESPRLAWFRDERDVAQSWWLGADPPRSEPGILVSDGREIWRFVMEEVPIPTTACDEASTGIARPPGDGTGTRATVVGLASKTELVVVQPPTDEGANEISHRVDLIASVGPLLFLRDWAYTYTCGAHGGVYAAPIIWDLETRAAISILSTADRERVTRDLGVRARTALEGSVGEGLLDTESPKLVGVIPGYDAAGRLRVDYAFTGTSCYACSDSQWGSYTSQVLVPAPSPPGRLGAVPDSGPLLARFLREHPGLRLGGWSVPPPG